MKKILTIEGMMCKKCQRRVLSILNGVSGVDSVSVDLAQKTAEVEGSGFTDEALRAVVEEADYKVTEIRTVG